MVSITDVAELAGVSVTTVSHAISGKRRVSDEVKDRVFDAMNRLGYSPSRSAQNLARGSTKVIALLVPDIGNGFFAELAQGVERMAIAKGYNMLLGTTGFDHDRELSYLEMIRSRAVDGIIYAAGSPPENSELVALLDQLPLVLLDEEIAESNFHTVVSDNRAGGSVAARHLLDLGHRRALILEAQSDLISNRLRVEGFSDVWNSCEGATLQIASGGSFTDEGGRAAIRPYLPAIARGEITAVFTTNDLIGLGAMDALLDAGIAIPSQVSVVGFDDSPAARYFRPRLTTVRQNVVELGEVAAAALIRSLDGDGRLPSGRHVLPVELVARESTAAVPPGTSPSA